MGCYAARMMQHLAESRGLLQWSRPVKPPGGGDAAEGGISADHDVEIEEQRQRETRPHRRLLCAACGQLVTTEDNVIEVANQHCHTFVNPGGFVYTIRCFSHAPGSAGEGESSDHWSWFPGYRWQVAACVGCAVQLGWIFRGADHVFFGLIVERLAEGLDE